ncbi:MAG: tetratricopeptide repeat protein [Deltaproteobacteria bacterium]|nr:tetratricopeptide repeat protein [Deltaproteobacteria bacterium]
MISLHSVALPIVLALATTACLDPATEHRVRANAYLRGGDAQKALDEVDVGLGKRPKDVSLLVMRGKSLFELGRYADARAAYRQAIAGSPAQDRSLSEAHLGLAMASLRESDTTEARREFEALVKLDERDADARLNLARVCLQVGDHACAVEHAEAAAHVRGSSEDVLFTLGRIYVVANKLDEAQKTFARIAEVVPNASSAPYGLALVLARRGEKDAAFAKLDEAIAKKLPNPDKLADDPLLVALREEPRFNDLVAKAKH